jgi:hypothetical protein
LEFIARETASRQLRGSAAPKLISGPSRRGTQTSNRGSFSAATVASAICSGVTRLTPRRSGTPVASSVRAKPGMTTVISTPVSRSSARTASERPITACLVAQ